MQNTERLKRHLQNYIDIVAQPRINKEISSEPLTLKVHEILWGTYKPPMLHIFIDIDPESGKSHKWEIEKILEQFIKMFAIQNKVKFHWNKRPYLKKAMEI